MQSKFTNSTFKKIINNTYKPVRQAFLNFQFSCTCLVLTETETRMDKKPVILLGSNSQEIPTIILTYPEVPFNVDYSNLTAENDNNGSRLMVPGSKRPQSQDISVTKKLTTQEVSDILDIFAA